MDSPFKSSLTAISIGPGILGIERGVERIARLTHLAYVEIEAFIIENLVAQMERGILAPAVIWSDAKTLPCEPFRGFVDILFAGYPCQPFSTAGKRRGTEDPRHLYPYIERAIRIIRPRICFFENVRGHVTCGLPEVIASLEGLGYRVHWGIYSAEETGAAHKRERVFIFAVANSHSDESKRDGRSGRMEDSKRDNQSKKDQWQWLRNAIRASSETKLANDNSLHWREQQQLEGSYRTRSRDESTGSSELANTGIEGHIQWRAGIQPAEGRIDAQHDITACGSEVMGNSNNSGLQGRISGECEEHTGEWRTRANGPFARVSRPGEPQQAWEHPRVISRKVESSVGLSAHGYHFREDVLRALGNSVYADTAELAFKDLIRKHGIDMKRLSKEEKENG